jgi:hypothetical protein
MVRQRPLVSYNPAMEIRLIRHGHSAQLPPLSRITAGEFRRWIEDYNRSGIAVDSVPPQELVTALCGTLAVVCSDYPRAIESANKLVSAVEPQILPLFREAGRPLMNNWGIKLSLPAWDCISTNLWRIGIIVGDESIRAARRRAGDAAAFLVRLAEDSDRVLCVGHGTFNALIGEKLREFGWNGPRKISDQHWQGGTFSKSAV